MDSACELANQWMHKNVHVLTNVETNSYSSAAIGHLQTVFAIQIGDVKLRIYAHFCLDPRPLNVMISTKFANFYHLLDDINLPPHPL